MNTDTVPLFLDNSGLASGYNGEKENDALQIGEKKDVISNGPEPEKVIEDAVINPKVVDVVPKDEPKRKYKEEKALETAPNDQKKIKHGDGKILSKEDEGKAIETADIKTESNGKLYFHHHNTISHTCT